MAKVIWAPSALEDVNSIAEYIARDSVDRSALFVMRLIEATDRLQEFPLSGRVIPEICDPSCREIIWWRDRCFGVKDNVIGSPSGTNDSRYRDSGMNIASM